MHGSGLLTIIMNQRLDRIWGGTGTIFIYTVDLKCSTHLVSTVGAVKFFLLSEPESILVRHVIDLIICVTLAYRMGHVACIDAMTILLTLSPVTVCSGHVLDLQDRVPASQEPPQSLMGGHRSHPSAKAEACHYTRRRGRRRVDD